MGHGTGYCGTLLDIIQEKIANEELDYSPEGSKIEKDPLPNQNSKEKERPVAFSGMASDFDPQETEAAEEFITAEDGLLYGQHSPRVSPIVSPIVSPVAHQPKVGFFC